MGWTTFVTRNIRMAIFLGSICEHIWNCPCFWLAVYCLHFQKRKEGEVIKLGSYDLGISLVLKSLGEWLILQLTRRTLEDDFNLLAFKMDYWSRRSKKAADFCHCTARQNKCDFKNSLALSIFLWAKIPLWNCKTLNANL